MQKHEINAAKIIHNALQNCTGLDWTGKKRRYNGYFLYKQHEQQHSDAAANKSGDDDSTGAREFPAGHWRSSISRLKQRCLPGHSAVHLRYSMELNCMSTDAWSVYLSFRIATATIGPLEIVYHGVVAGLMPGSTILLPFCRCRFGWERKCR